jgi:UDP-N-acetylmuramoyl-tripeptide--D-alanyl-D-alanine ligase
MAEFTVDEVRQAIKGNLLCQGRLTKFAGVSTDTRTIGSGDLFVALSGESYDAHDFLDQAIAKGAGGIVVSREKIRVPEDITVFHVPDTLRALQDLAQYHRLRFSIPVVAVTGSNGKTTTKDMIAAILAQRFQVLKTEANFNNEIGLPLTILKLNPSHEIAVVEMGMRGSGQIRELANIALPNIAVITNVGETHMELLGSIEKIAEAKAEILEGLPYSGFAVLNADNSYVRNMAEKVQCRTAFYGIEQGDIRAANIEFTGRSMMFECVVNDSEVFSVHVPAVGRHNVYNTLAAICVGRYLGLDFQEINEGLSGFNAGGMRLQIEKTDRYTVINDAYNASPASMEAAIDALVDIAPQRKLAVLGDMLELGHVAIEAHRRIGKKLAACRVDAVVTVGGMAAHIAGAAKEAGVPVAVACESHEEAKKVLGSLVAVGDTVLLKGSRGMKMEKLMDVFF